MKPAQAEVIWAHGDRWVHFTSFLVSAQHDAEDLRGRKERKPAVGLVPVPDPNRLEGAILIAAFLDAPET